MLTDDESLEEIARMLGGMKITKRTRDHAGEMLASARSQDINKDKQATTKKQVKKKQPVKKEEACKDMTAKPCNRITVPLTSRLCTLPAILSKN